MSTGGAPFWGGSKRAPPVPLKYNEEDGTALQMVVAGANLRAGVYGLKGQLEISEDLEVVREALAGFRESTFQPQVDFKREIQGEMGV